MIRSNTSELRMAATPRDLYTTFTAAFHAGDLEGLVTLYEPNATFVPQPGTAVTGHAAIREAIRGFLATKGVLQMTVRGVYETGDLALALADWSLQGTATEGSELNLKGRTSDVLRR